jgi:hypothetical protein
MHLRWIVAASVVCLAACESTETDFPLAVDERDPSVARLWNEALLESISRDFARPPVVARNLWQMSAAMYDAWAAYDDVASTWLLGKSQAGYSCEFNPRFLPRDRHRAREEAISYAAYRIIRHRFKASPGAAITMPKVDQLMATLGYDISFTGTNYELGDAAALGNHIAECYIAYGFVDGSNEANNYASTVYKPLGPPLEPEKPGNPTVVDLDRWQEIKLTLSIDQNGNIVSAVRPFIAPEWGNVQPFAMTAADRTQCQRSGFNFPVYMDPGPPPGIHSALSAEFKWTHELVLIWSSQLSTTQGRGAELIDISPATMGNISVGSYPTTFAEHRDFYNLFLGDTTANHGYTLNPATGAPYTPQLVPLGDYARAVAEYWADGPNSVAPPGHWYDIANHVSDHPLLVRRIEGVGPTVGPLEWDVKLYFALGGAEHDAAIAAWSIKGCYDSSRPVAAIRAMADLGQSSNPLLPHYHPDGLPLVPGYVELVQVGDPLADNPLTPLPNDHVNKIKVFAWRGPPYINNPNFDTAGVGWILAENWWPYQAATFVTPPFAGFPSGHSTFSRTAAELLAAFTGDEYFPGGKSDIRIARNQYLRFEEGPTVDIVFEWARYVDASDQCSLSRIWMGIHPPVDDIAGRHIGMKLGPQVFQHALDYFNGRI